MRRAAVVLAPSAAARGRFPPDDPRHAHGVRGQHGQRRPDARWREIFCVRPGRCVASLPPTPGRYAATRARAGCRHLPASGAPARTPTASPTLTRKNGSLSLEECLARLVKTGVIDKAEALGRAVHPDDFEHALKS